MINLKTISIVLLSLVLCNPILSSADEKKSDEKTPSTPQSAESAPESEPESVPEVQEETSEKEGSPIHVSFDIRSGDIIEKSSESVQRKSELFTDFLLCRMILDKVSQRKISLTDTVKPQSTVLNTSSLRLDQEKPYSLKELITALLFLNSPDARLALHEFLKSDLMDGLIVTSPNCKVSTLSKELQCTSVDLSKTISSLFTDLEENGIDPFSKEFTIGDASYPSLIKQSIGEQTKILIFTDPKDHAAIVLAYVKHEQTKNPIKEVCTVYFSEDKKISNGQLIRVATNHLSSAVNDHETIKIIPKGKIIANIPLEGAEKDSLTFISPEDVYVSLKKSELQGKGKKVVELLIERDDPIKLPITNGSQIGTLKIVFDGQTLKNIPLVANENIDSKKKLKFFEKGKSDY